MADASQLDGQQPGPSSGETRPTRDLGQQLEFVCVFPGCPKSFNTKTGLGVHQQKTHKNWYDARQPVVHKKARWTQEESALLVRREAKLKVDGSRDINNDLQRLFVDRTVDAIKSRRRNSEHQLKVKEAVRKLSESAVDRQNEEPIVPLAAAMQEGPGEDLGKEEVWMMVISFIESLPAIQNDLYQTDRLSWICRSIKRWNSAQVLEEISLYLREVFPIKILPEGRQARPRTTGSQVPKRKMRRREYARVQQAWKKNRSNCIRSLLKDKVTSNAPPKEVMIPFWESIMTAVDDSTPGVERKKGIVIDLWIPILCKEVEESLPAMGTAPGPDGFTARELRAVPLGIITRILNIFILCGQLPDHLLESRTTLIPKKDGASEPGDFRPITVSSVIARTFHKVLANRLSRLVDIDERQRAFRPVDGCSENIFLMDFALRSHRQSFKPLFMASLDVAKAFDSVTHQTIIDTLLTAGVPALMVGYIADTYRRSSTRLRLENWESHNIHPTCGVKQGDPLSPMIFNLVIDRLFAALPEEVGMRLGTGNPLSAIAFADDLVLFALTKEGLQSLLDVTAQYLQKCGLRVNVLKCSTVAIRNVPKEKKSVVDAGTQFTCNGFPIPALRRTDEWKYLGVPFTAEGRLLSNPLGKLRNDLDKLSAAPLKPQQRLFALRTAVLPGLYHLLVLGLTNISLLNKLDILVRTALRKWMDLPHDVPKAYFHADVKDGGLSFPSLRWVIPLQRFHRLRNLKIRENPDAPEEMRQFAELEIKRVQQRLKDHQTLIRTREGYKKRQAKVLHSSNDGRPLINSRDVVGQHRWLTDGNMFVSGRDFIRMNKLRINAIPLRTRMARGQIRDRHCRAGCNDSETLHHVLQICHRTHAERIKRHNACLSFLVRRLGDGVQFSEEPVFQTPAGTLKPDVIVKKDSMAIVIDARIAGERADLQQAHQDKITKYKVLEADVKKRYSVNEVVFTSLTISSRGVWSKDSYNMLRTLKLIRAGDDKILSSRVLVGGLNAVRMFYRTTAVRRRTHPRGLT